MLIIFSLIFCLTQKVNDETASAMEQLKEAQFEAKALRTMTQRLVLTHEEMVGLTFPWYFYYRWQDGGIRVGTGEQG